MANFWLGEVIKVLVFFASTFVLGRFMVQRGVKVNYTRKIFHFIFFFLPVFLASVLPFEHSIPLTFLSGCVVMACLALMYQPIRQKSTFLSTAYSAIDRPEDRPFTLVWVSTQMVATYMVLVVMLLLLELYDKSVLMFMTVFVAGVGDGLAEPVGIRFGKHAYKAHALFTDKKYTRTVEGSMCVFFSGILAVVLLAGNMNQLQIILALLIFPLTMTLAEALSPHTWDAPFLYLAGGVSTVAVLELSSHLLI